MELKINTDAYPEETSWEILDTCSGDTVIHSGDFGYGDNQDYYESSKEVCVDENGRYKFKILDSNGDGIYDDEVQFDFDYSLVYNGELIAETNDFRGSGFATHFGEGSCCGEGQKLVELKINTDAYPGHTSWEILDTCSGETVHSGDFGDGDNQEYYMYESSKEVCVNENGRYKFKISDSNGDGIDDDEVHFEFDYSLIFDGDLVVEEKDFNDRIDEHFFGDSSFNENMVFCDIVADALGGAFTNYAEAVTWFIDATHHPDTMTNGAQLEVRICI